MELPENLEPDNPLWYFALTFWQHSSAQQTCLALQNEGWSVTRILCAGWLALNGRSYTGIEDATVTEWRDRVTGSCVRFVRRCQKRRLHTKLCAQTQPALSWRQSALNWLWPGGR
ncbi:DUF2390 domain-containing protein [Marinobacter sp. AC-23]|uniref:DUF2390 domain-containing protein n=1 Tax=Marinobacter sp. AC-23 TaxID=1879031 RepID=UPI0020C8BB1E|nr:DUF2390 domain-containing protein [Marinobacter sp. AC-23]